MGMLLWIVLSAVIFYAALRLAVWWFFPKSTE